MKLKTLFVAAALALAAAAPAHADETCNSPYLTRLVKGQEDYVHVWTLGMPGVGDGNDKLVTVDVNPRSRHYGRVVHTLSVPGRGEAHHTGFSDDRRYLWAGRLDDSKIFVFDLQNPRRPRLARTIDDFASGGGWVGPHTFYALPGRMLVGGLSNPADHGGRTGMVLYNHRGDRVQSIPMPTGMLGGANGDGYAYDIAIHPGRNLMVTTSFTGWNNYMMDFGRMLQDPEAMKNFGRTMVLWDAKALLPRQIFEVPGAPLEVRWSLAEGDEWAVTAAALTSKLWLLKRDAQGQWQARAVADIGDPAQVPLPVDISITADGKGLWVSTFMDGTLRHFDMRDPEHPRETFTHKVGPQLNMVSQSWDGRRLYTTSSLIANWDKKGADNEQKLRAFDWDGQRLVQRFELDFIQLGLGRAHHMKFSARPQGRVLGAEARP